MQIPVSGTGEIVLPGSFSEMLGIRPGDPLEARIEAGRIVLTQPAVRRPGTGIITDPRTGLPVLSGGEGAPELTSEMVAAILADFP
jgi:hypothetical protein